MGLYKYKGKNFEGKTERGVTIAESLKSARTALSERGILIETIREATFDGKFTKPLRARFYDDAGMLLSQGFTIDEALSLLIDEYNGENAAILTSLRDKIQNGTPLSKAIAELSGHLPGFERAALKTAEETGSQDKLLTRLADFINADYAIQSRIRSALVYPAAVLVLAFSLLILMVFVILPKAEAIFPKNGNAANAIAVVKTAPVIMGAVMSLAVITVAVFVYMAVKARKNKEDAIRYEKLLIKLPLIKRLLPLLWASRFSSTMGLLIKSGLTPQSAITPAGSATGSEYLTLLAASASEQVTSGISLAKAISQIKPISSHLGAWIGVGEKGGALGDTLEKASARARSEYEKILTQTLSLLEPALVAFVGAIVLFVALSVIRPMLALTTNGI